jgi:dolichyl-phosphate-mannose--protein O-mannosyl transferase
VLTFRKKKYAYIEPDANRARTVFLMVGWLAMLLPWVTITRCAFAYHYFPCTVFLALALMAAADRLWAYRTYKGAQGLAESTVHAVPLILAAAAVVLFAMFYPVLSGAGASNFWLKNVLKWLPSWPF